MAGTARRVSGVVLIMFGVLFAVVGGVAAPVAADEHDEVNRECNGAFQGTPEGSLAIASTPAAGDIDDDVASISVTATWDEGDWSGETLDKILNCVTVNGVLVDDLSSIDKPTDNDESEGFTIDVADLEVGDEVCARVRLSGTPTAQNPSTQKSNVLCWTLVDQPATPVRSYTCAAPTLQNGNDATLKGSTDDPNVTGASFALTKTGGSAQAIAATGSNGAFTGAANDLPNGDYTYTITFTGPDLSKTSGTCAFTVNVQSSVVTVDDPKQEAVVAGVQVSRESTPAVIAATAAAPAVQGVALAATGLSPALLGLGLGLVGLGSVLVIGARRTVRPAGQHYIA